MARRRFLSQLVGLPFLALGVKAEESKKALKMHFKRPDSLENPR
jgi:hypothetical protein